MSLREMLSDYWYAFQQELFPRLESELGPMGERYELFVAVLELVRVEALLPYFRGQVGRPEEDRAALARAFIAKAVFDVPTTRGLIERLEVDGRLCRLCGWSGAGRLPSEATFSRAFSEFAESGLASRLHETLIARTMDGHLVEHISRDATAIEAREKPAPKPKAAKPKRRRKRGRPRKGEEQAKEPSRLERQLTMSLPQMLADLPRACDVGTKRNAKGHTTSWIGYKLHVDTADGGIPISCIMTSASTHDSQVAIPLPLALRLAGSGPGHLEHGDTLGYGRERPQEHVWRNATRWARAGVTVALPEGFTVGGGGELRRTDYRGRWYPFVLDGSAREDRTRILRVSVLNRSLTVFGFSPQLVLVNEARSSNAQLYDYKRNRAELRIQRLF